MNSPPNAKPVDVVRIYTMEMRNILIVFTFIFLTGCSLGYENDGQKVFYGQWNEGSGGNKIELNANPKTFHVLKFKTYAKDDKLAFYEGQVVQGADAATFEALDNLYARDKFRGYYAGEPVIQSQGPRFKIIDSYYSTDGLDIFYRTDPLGVCSVENFQTVYVQQEWEKWTTDGCYYYFMNFKIPSEDYKNVVIFKKSFGLARDNKWVYFMDRKINFNDKGNRILDTVDVETFQVTDYLACKDKFGCINPYHGREDCR